MKNFMTILGLTTGLLISAQASALSCAVSPIIEKVYHEQAQQRNSVVMIGKFTNLQPINQNSPVQMLNFYGLAHKIPTPSPTPPNISTLHLLSVDTVKVSVWTGYPPSDGGYIIFAKRTANPQMARTSVGPCPYSIFEYNDDNVQRLQACFATGC